MKTDIVCDDEYEAQKLMSLIFIKEDKETYISGILNIIKNEIIISLKDKSAHSILLKDEENVEKFADSIQLVFDQEHDSVSTKMNKSTIEIIKDGNNKIIPDKNHNIKNLNTKNIIKKKPITIGQNILAAEALAIMNSKKITCLCVHDKKNKNKTIGILTIHNILNANIQ